MDKIKKNLFLEKFSILNSQEHSEEIQWSSSCSSEYDSTSTCDRSFQVHRTRVLKRKRKNKGHNNKSNLNITILDAHMETKTKICEKKSSIQGNETSHASTSPSPILKSRSLKKDNTVTSPVLTSKTINIKSPILASKTASHKSAKKVRKQLFRTGNLNTNGINTENPSINMYPEEFRNKLTKQEPGGSKIIACESVEFENFQENATLNENNLNDRFELVNRLKSFFDSHFCSENTSQTSQNSISEISTPINSTKTSGEIEIFTCNTQVPNTSYNTAESKVDLSLSANSSENSAYDFNKNIKKIYYKKNGHAYRLNKLLKKQNASVSLWQHERFLAANSNFIIPKEDFSVYRIQKVYIKYGCHLIECVNENDNLFLVLINSHYFLESFVSDSLLKLYKPYNILSSYKDIKLIINVVRFECCSINSA